VLAPCPDELAWLSTLAGRFGVAVSPHAALVFDEVSAACFGGIAFGDVGEHSELPAPAAAPARGPAAPAAPVDGLRLVAYRPLFSGAAVARSPELQFQRPAAELEISRADARAHGLKNGAAVAVSSNGTSVRLRARIARDLTAGTVRIPQEHAGELNPIVAVQVAAVSA
jgi:anaerobic selenocysteine-containing dehydrogenase